MTDLSNLRQELAKALYGHDVGSDVGLDALMPTVVQALADAWDNGFIAADMNTPRSRKGHWKDDHPRKGLRTWIPDPIPTNPFASSGDTTNGDK